MIEQHSQAVIIRRAEREQRESAERAAYERGKALENSQTIIGYLKQVAGLVAREKGLPGKYAILRSAGLDVRKIQKQASEGELVQVVRRDFRLENTPALLKFLKVEDPDLVQDVNAINEEKTSLSGPFIPVGEALCALTEKAFYGRH